MDSIKIMRKDHEQPFAIKDWGWKFHHIGIPTNKALPGETYLADFKLYFSGFNTSPFGIEWMRYEEGCPVHELIRTVPHIAFEVENLELEMQRSAFKIITPLNSPSEGVRVAMIEHNGAPIELIEFTDKFVK
jgi:hypothetical protein